MAVRELPTTRQEDWKYTRVSHLARWLEEPTLAAKAEAPTFEQALSAAGLTAWPGPVAVFVDGAFAPAASRLAELPQGLSVTARSAGGPATDDPALIALPDDVFSDRVAQQGTDGAIVRIADRTVCDRPLLIVMLATREAASHGRSVVHAGAQCQVAIAQVHASLTPGASFSNQACQFILAPQAVVTHTWVQRLDVAASHVSRILAVVGRDASFTSHAVSLGAALSRCDLVVKLAAEGASCVLNGLYATDGTQHVDFHTAIEHAQPHTTSVQLYKGLLDGASTGVFNGKVMVRPHAQKTSAMQVNRNLLLSAKAQINTKPQLEIFADDVKCSHGATIGQLDLSALFYLRSRGLSAEQARQVLLHAFASEVLSGVEPPELRRALGGLQGEPA